MAHACVCLPVCQEAGHPSQVTDLGLSRGRGRWCPTVDSLSGPGRLLPWLLESTRAACRHTCLRARDAWGQGRREGGAQECLLFSSPSPLSAEAGRQGPARAVGGAREQAPGPDGDGRAGSERRGSQPSASRLDSGVFPRHTGKIMF